MSGLHRSLMVKKNRLMLEKELLYARKRRLHYQLAKASRPVSPGFHTAADTVRTKLLYRLKEVNTEINVVESRLEIFG